MIELLCKSSSDKALKSLKSSMLLIWLLDKFRNFNFCVFKSLNPCKLFITFLERSRVPKFAKLVKGVRSEIRLPPNKSLSSLLRFADLKPSKLNIWLFFKSSHFKLLKFFNGSKLVIRLLFKKRDSTLGRFFSGSKSVIWLVLRWRSQIKINCLRGSKLVILLSDKNSCCKNCEVFNAFIFVIWFPFFKIMKKKTI